MKYFLADVFLVGMPALGFQLPLTPCGPPPTFPAMTEALYKAPAERALPAVVQIAFSSWWVAGLSFRITGPLAVPPSTAPTSLPGGRRRSGQALLGVCAEGWPGFPCGSLPGAGLRSCRACSWSAISRRASAPGPGGTDAPLDPGRPVPP